MADPTVKLRQAVFDKLVAGALGVTVYSRAPDNLVPPFVLLGQIQLQPQATKDRSVFEASFEVISVVTGRSPAPAEAIMAKVFDALQMQTITASGASFTPPLLQSSGSQSNEEKTLYFGLQTFNVFAEF